VPVLLVTDGAALAQGIELCFWLVGTRVMAIPNAWRCGNHRTPGCLGMNGQRPASERAFQNNNNNQVLHICPDHLA
jgi:hypothetical protein